MDRNVLNDVINILCTNIEKVHGVIITNEYLDRIVFSNEYMNNIILEYNHCR